MTPAPLTPPVAPAIVILHRPGIDLARRITAHDDRLAGAMIYAPRALAGDDPSLIAYEDLRGLLEQLFLTGQPIVGLCAAGILIRLIAPLLRDKHHEPPVIAVAEGTGIARTGAVVPLLGSHHGGTALARQIAQALAATLITTGAGEGHLGLALDDPPPGWRLANPDDLKAFTGRLLDTISPEGGPSRLLGRRAAGFARTAPPARQAAFMLRGSLRPQAGSNRCLVYHPAKLALGVGCVRGADPGAIADLVMQTLVSADLSAKAVGVVATIDLKQDEPALIQLAKTLDVPIHLFAAAHLDAQPVGDSSAVVKQAVGSGSVAEAAALAAACPKGRRGRLLRGRLLLGKHKNAHGTCAVALAHQPGVFAGRPPGCLFVVSLGPGDPAMRTLAAARTLVQVTDLVGYHGYLAQIPGRPGITRHGFALGEEDARVMCALDLAARGRQVALVCSGDAGIYAMASPVFAQIERTPAWQRVRVQVLPGVSASQAAASRVGGFLGHDFCVLSLSDLLTPRDVILQRLQAALAGDFIIALYNPTSRKRGDLFRAALEQIGQDRAPSTPVVIARQVTRAQERVEVITVAELNNHRERIDMHTVILIGATRSRAFAHLGGMAGGMGSRMAAYTPRGYEEKS
ncbi:MAG: cobalamin biosynthesis protein [Pseudomonadota bacterium]